MYQGVSESRERTHLTWLVLATGQDNFCYMVLDFQITTSRRARPGLIAAFITSAASSNRDNPRTSKMLVCWSARTRCRTSTHQDKCKRLIFFSDWLLGDGSDSLVPFLQPSTLMQKALYFPHTDIENPVILKNALLLWDSVDTIVPGHNWRPHRRPPNKLVSEAIELVVGRRVPSQVERTDAHRILEESVRSGFVSSLVERSPGEWRRRHYLIYPEKFSDETWHLLQRGGTARWAAAERDYGVPAAVGFFMMSVLADVCAGTQIQKITDRADAYEWLGRQHARALGSQYVKGFDASQVAPAYDRLVSLSINVLDGREIPLKKLVELRKRELKNSGASYSGMRRRYFSALQEHLEEIGKEAQSASDLKELDRQFKESLKEDLTELKAELRVANLKTLFSKEVALTALIVAGSVAAPIAGFTALAAQVGGIGIIPLAKAAVDYRASRREALQKHKMSWLFLAKQGRLPVL